jgi:hypothetical protein
LFAYENKVYALDSNTDTLHIVHPEASIERLPFDVPILAVYRRDSSTEWISSRIGFLWERKVGQTGWKRVELGSIQQSIVYEGDLYVERRIDDDKQNDLATISRVKDAKVIDSWKTCFTGFSNSSPPVFLDEAKNLARISAGRKSLILPARSLPFIEARASDVFANGWVDGRAFVTQTQASLADKEPARTELLMIGDGAVTRTGLLVRAHTNVHTNGSDAWVAGERAGRPVIAHYRRGTWQELELRELELGSATVHASGERACVIIREDGGNHLAVVLRATGDLVESYMVRIENDVFNDDTGVVHASGFWWISPQHPGELIKIASDPTKHDAVSAH